MGFGFGVCVLCGVLGWCAVGIGLGFLVCLSLVVGLGFEFWVFW